MKIMYLPVEVTDDDGVTSEEIRRYKIKDIGSGWFDLSCDGNFIAKLLGEQECRRVIWAYWTNLGVDMAYLTDDDFDEVDDDA